VGVLLMQHNWILHAASDESKTARSTQHNSLLMWRHEYKINNNKSYTAHGQRVLRVCWSGRCRRNRRCDRGGGGGGAAGGAHTHTHTHTQLYSLLCNKPRYNSPVDYLNPR